MRPRRRSSATSRMKLVSWKARPSWRAGSRAPAQGRRTPAPAASWCRSPRRTLHVPEQVVVAWRRSHGEVHGHRGQEGAEIGLRRCRRSGRCAPPRPAPGHRIGPPAGTRRTRSPKSVRPRRARGRAQAVVQVIHDLVGVPGEAVQRVHVRPLPVREQPGRQVVGGTVPAVQLATALIGGGQGGGAGCGGRRSGTSRCAWARPGPGRARPGPDRSAPGAGTARRCS